VIVLDTHAWVRWLHPELGQGIPTALRTWLDNADDTIAISVISALEVSQLARKGVLQLPLPLPEWFAEALDGSGIGCLQLTPELAHASTMLPMIHKDPADRIIIATAQANNAPLVTTDGTIGTYPNLETVWGSPPAPGA
jgi:PIN domain nuclease of toxin-antitoxin system